MANLFNIVTQDWLIHHNSSAQATSPRGLVIDADEDISVLTRTYSKLAKMIVDMIPIDL